MTAKEQVLEQAFKLNPEERLSLVQSLLDSLDSDRIILPDAQLKEILRRREEMIHNPKMRVPWSVVQKELMTP